MAKQRYTIPGGGKFGSYEEAKRFRDNSATVRNVEKMGGEIQIRKTEFGYKVVVRREVK